MVFLDVHGISVKVVSSDDFELFVKNSFPYFLTNIKDKPELNICIDINLDKNVDCVDFLSKATKIGRNAYIDNSSFYCVSSDYFITAKKDGECLNISVSLIKLISARERVKRYIKSIIRPHDKFLLVRHYVIFPLFSLFSKYKNINVLHASAVNINGKGVIFSGLSGVGKSTLSIASVIAGKSLFVTDNYLLYDDKKVYPFPEWIRLNRESYRLIGIDKSGVVEKVTRSFFYRYDRNYHQLEKGVISRPVKCSAFIQLFIGDKFSIRDVSIEKMIDRVVLNNSHVREFPEHSLIGLISYILENNTCQIYSMIESLKSLVSNAKICEVTINKNDTIDKSVDNIYRAIGAYNK